MERALGRLPGEVREFARRQGLQIMVTSYGRSKPVAIRSQGSCAIVVRRDLLQHPEELAAGLCEAFGRYLDDELDRHIPWRRDRIGRGRAARRRYAEAFGAYLAGRASGPEAAWVQRDMDTVRAWSGMAA